MGRGGGGDEVNQRETDGRNRSALSPLKMLEGGWERMTAPPPVPATPTHLRENRGRQLVRVADEHAVPAAEPESGGERERTAQELRACEARSGPGRDTTQCTADPPPQDRNTEGWCQRRPKNNTPRTETAKFRGFESKPKPQSGRTGLSCVCMGGGGNKAART